MKLRIWFAQPVDIDLSTADDPATAEEFVLNASPKELEDYVNENWTELVDPSKPLISSVEVVR